MTYRQTENLRRSFEPFAERVYRAALNKQLKQVNFNYEQPQRLITEEPIIDAYRRVYNLVMPEFGRQTIQRFKSSHGKLITKDRDLQDPNWDDIVSRFISINLGARIVGVTEYSRQIVERIILTAMDQNLSIPQTQKLLRTQWRDMARFRAVRIARTEIISASNAGSLNGAQSLNVPMVRTWLATGGKRTRDAHAIAHGQKVDIRGNYIVGGELLRFPGDPRGSAENVINCRCAETYELV